MNHLSDSQISVYEEPVHERIRKLIKLELLFNQIHYFKNKEGNYDNYVALLSMSNLYQILVRSDIKSELISEIDNQNRTYKKLKKIPAADQKKLNSILEKQEMLLKVLHKVQSNYLDYLEHDILFKAIVKNSNSSLQPSSIEFWLSRDVAFRNDQIEKWLEPISFIERSSNFILEVIRKSGSFADKFAERGFYMEKLDIKKNILLIRVNLTSDLYYFPQISVSKQRLNIIFMTKDDKNNFIPHQEDLSFMLTLCSI